MKFFISTIFALSLFSINLVFARDTIRVMQYNLLYYDMNTSWCTSANNNVDQKDDYLKTITGYYQPDIFTVNEMNGSVSSVNRLLNNVFNSNQALNYKRANYTGNYLVNMLYYNANKLELQSQSYVLTSPRITDVYRLYYKSNELEQGDTVFITCFVTHLKAGNTTSDASSRAEATQQIMTFINNRDLTGNILFMGDFNVYRSSETAFQNLLTQTSTGIRFYDPANAIGDWHDNPSFSNFHTQSTYTSGECPSGGGMDDRFDFILGTLPILQGTHGAKYVDGSYWAFGQDGQRLNQSLIDPPNNSLPGSIIDALYKMSDHLPVVLKLSIDATPLSATINGTEKNSLLRVTNPIGNELKIWSDSNKQEQFYFQLVNQLGAIIVDKRIILGPGEKYMINVSDLASGIYLVRAVGDGFQSVQKIIKN